MILAEILRSGSGCGEAEARREIEQYARDYDWSDTQPRIMDPGYAADEIIGELVADVAGEIGEDRYRILRAELATSAERENTRRALAIAEGR